MAYLIKIHSDGTPRLVGCPDKPTFSALELLSPAVDTDTPIKQYQAALQQALDDESKHIQFKNQEYVLDLLPNRRFENRDGDTFPLPIGVSVSFENHCRYKEEDGNCPDCFKNHLCAKLATLSTPTTLIHKDAKVTLTNCTLISAKEPDKESKDEKESQDEMWMDVCVESHAIEKVGVSKVIRILREKFKIERRGNWDFNK